MEPLDHKNLDKDVPYFAEVVRWVLGAPPAIGCRVKEQSSRLSRTSESSVDTCVCNAPVNTCAWQELVPCLPSSPAGMQPASLCRAGGSPAGAAAVLRTGKGTACSHLRRASCRVSLLLCGQSGEADRADVLIRPCFVRVCWQFKPRFHSAVIV